jgi:hypothetical protein
MLDDADALSKLEEFMNAFNKGDMARWASYFAEEVVERSAPSARCPPGSAAGCAFSRELEAVGQQHGRPDRCRFTWQLMRKPANASTRR